jgi:uncharacterized membrane protein YhhN
VSALLAGLALASVTALLLTEAQYPRLEWLFKPLAALCFVALALHLDALQSEYGRWLLAGLLLCLLGDVLLIANSDAAFLAGLGSFLLGHLLYGVAFLTLPLNPTALLAGVALAVALLGTTLRWLWPRVPAPMRAPVAAYMLAIGAMLVLATGSIGVPAAGFIVAGAWGFAISDIFVARQQFVKTEAVNRRLGLPLYFAAQLALAYSLAVVS